MINQSFFPSQYEHIAALLRPTRAYLVGGAVRDALLKRPVHDLDFALPGGTIKAAKQVADRLGGAFFLLDPERETCRVILKDREGQRLVVDFTLFQGQTIEDDLASRDFTITSMALDLQEDARLLDLFQGAQDLRDGLIRATTLTSLQDDPMRCLRAVRLAAQLNFRILPETRDQIRRYRHHLEAVSPERKRDEFFRLLEGPNQSAGIQSLGLLGIYPYLLPGEVTSNEVRILRNLESLWSLFLTEHDQEQAANWPKGLLVHRLGRFRAQLGEYLGQELVPGRSVYQLSLILPLLQGFPWGEANLTFRQVTGRIALSNRESSFLEKAGQAAASWPEIDQESGRAQPVEVYRLFNHFGQAGVGAIFLCLGEALEDQRGEHGQDRWIEHLDRARYFLEGYWERRREWVDPPALLTGDDIQRELGLPPGPRIGSLLELLREEQVRTGIKTREEGLAYLRDQSVLSAEGEA